MIYVCISSVHGQFSRTYGAFAALFLVQVPVLLVSDPVALRKLTTESTHVLISGCAALIFLEVRDIFDLLALSTLDLITSKVVTLPSCNLPFLKRSLVTVTAHPTSLKLTNSLDSKLPMTSHRLLAFLASS